MAFVVRPRVEIMLGPGDAIDTLESMLPTERAIYFLRNKGLDVAGRGAPATIQRQEAPFFRLVNSEGVIRDIDGLAWPRPFAEKAYVVDVGGRDFKLLINTLKDTVD